MNIISGDVWFKALFLGIITIVMASCASVRLYEGPDLPNEKLCIVSTPFALGMQSLFGISFINVDDIDALTKPELAKAERLLLQPGRHTITASLPSSTCSPKSNTISFSCKAGAALTIGHNERRLRSSDWKHQYCVWSLYIK
ncbi:MAG: hypothetical protein NT140_04275 [Deltaproteobacteria bacterium]|nr:hypothetical protein [Deltaproteobacteria bacterium]